MSVKAGSTTRPGSWQGVARMISAAIRIATKIYDVRKQRVLSTRFCDDTRVGVRTDWVRERDRGRRTARILKGERVDHGGSKWI